MCIHIPDHLTYHFPMMFFWVSLLRLPVAHPPNRLWLPLHRPRPPRSALPLLLRHGILLATSIPLVLYQ